MEGTAPLRAAAPQWSLAGDAQLLDILHNIHQSLVTRCQEVNRKLDEMVSALDGASVDLQNVNNKFMALSNSQFIESRVYDDDVDIAAQETPKVTPIPTSPSADLSRLKHSVATLVAAHETIEILASDSEDDDDDEARMILKPRDMYAHRPLPHIIGSQAWRNKWHAGLHPEDSDSDSSMSKQERVDEEYSDSEPEMETHPPAHHEREESTASSELPSEQDIQSIAASAPAVKPSPSDIAAELARRLGGQAVQIPIPEPEYAAPGPVARKVYRPEQPTPGTIFSDEPPPLDNYQSEESDSPDDDIFAELHKNKPYTHSNKDQSRLAEDLFAGLREYEEGDVFSDFKDTQSSSTPAKQKSTLFEDEPEPEMFEDKHNKPAPKQETAKPDVESVKKPIGGISLFGNPQGAESIGAAILRRNRKKSSSDEETNGDAPKNEQTQKKNQEKDIFDDLFAKSEKEQQKNTKKIVEKPVKEVEKPKTKIDLFSDNIFDDIDDIFTTNVTKSVKQDTNNQKSLFDDDEDDIFSDIAVTKNSNNAKIDNKSAVDRNKSIFDSDDDLFTDNIVHETEKKQPVEEIRTIEESSKQNKSNLFDNKGGDILTKSDIKNDNVIVSSNVNNEISINKVLKNTEHSDNLNNLLNNSLGTKDIANKIPNENNRSAAKSIFDDDDDGNDDLFGSIATKSSTSKHNTLTSSQTQSVKSVDKKSSLFDDDSDENDLFGTKSKHEDKSINKKTQNDEIQTEPKKSSTFDDLETENIFDNTVKQVEVNKGTSSDQNKILVEAEATIKNRKKSVFDDKEEALFGESIKKPVQNKPKPELLKKPTIVPRNNNHGTKKQDHTNKNEFKQESIAKETKHEGNHQNNVQKDIKRNSNEMVSDTSKNDFSTANISEETQPQNTEQAKVNLNEDKIESKLPLTKDNTASTSQENTEVVEEKLQPQYLPVHEENSESVANQSNMDFRYEEIESKIPDLDVPPPLDDTANNDDDIFADVPNDFSTKEPVFQTPNVFDDIFSEPPAFEKSKEPKKSKNINALFDDDSDDEALFFKKNEPVLDEKPDLSPDVSKDALFGIFHDEPPAIEVDFTQKPTKSNVNDDFLRSDSDNDLFGSQKAHEDELDSSFESDTKLPELPSNIGNKTHISQEKVNLENEKPVISSHKPQIDKPKPPLKESLKDTSDGEPKKVGKLKTMNFNIDVSTLLPGASPKKKALEQLDSKSSEDLHHKENKKSLEQTDGQIFAKSSEDLHSKERIEPLMAKSVSFEGEPDSQVLDNKISKERAKIQVKRRPSTRRARKEAVKKSAIEFGDDSTDNSSSIDDPPNRKPKVERIQSTTDDNTERDKSNHYDLDFEVNLSTTDDLNDLKPEIEVDISKSNETRTNLEFNSTQERLPIQKIESNEVLDRSTDQIDSITKLESDSLVPNTPQSNTVIKNITNTESDDLRSPLEPQIKENEPKYPDLAESKTEPTLASPNKSVTSKIVYILNDEDIFSTPAITTEVKPKVFDIDDDDLFKSNVKSKSSEVAPSISTLGNAYKDSNTENSYKKDTERNKKSLFDDLSDDDDELFNTNKKTTSKIKSILDSDSEEDLFGARKREANTKAPVVKEMKDTIAPAVKETKEVKRLEVKSSLFGDEDDDDLFGAKVKSNPATSPQPSRSTREVVTKAAEPVFDDPLSMLGDNDD